MHMCRQCEWLTMQKSCNQQRDRCDSGLFRAHWWTLPETWHRSASREFVQAAPARLQRAALSRPGLDVAYSVMPGWKGQREPQAMVTVGIQPTDIYCTLSLMLAFIILNIRAKNPVDESEPSFPHSCVMHVVTNEVRMNTFKGVKMIFFPENSPSPKNTDIYGGRESSMHCKLINYLHPFENMCAANTHNMTKWRNALQIAWMTTVGHT